MASTINSTDTGSGGLITTGDSSDELQLQTAETARVTLTNTAVVVNEDGNDVDFRVEGDTNANLLFVDASADAVLIGTNTAASTQGGNLQVITAQAIRRNVASSAGGALRLEKSRSATDGGYTIVQDGDSLGDIQWFGSDGVDFAQAATIRGIVNGTPGSNDMPGALAFLTSADGTQSPTERMRITSAGEVLVGGTTEIASVPALTIQRTDNVPALYIFRNDTSIGSGNILGAITFYGNDTTSNTPTQHAYIQTVASGAHSAGANPTDLVFGRTPSASETVTEIMRLTNGGYLQMASGTNGILFNGDSSAANALDDYEEGTWTPAYAFSTSGSVTQSLTSGAYTKIGNFVLVTFRIATSALSSPSGTVTINGLPFTSAGTNSGVTPGQVSGFGIDAPIRCQIGSSSSSISLLKNASNGTAVELQGADFASGSAKNLIDCSFSYRV